MNINTTLSEYFKFIRFFDQVPVVTLINKCIDIMGDQTYVKHEQKIEAVLDTYKSPSPSTNATVKEIVREWLKQKNQQHHAEYQAEKAREAKGLSPIKKKSEKPVRDEPIMTPFFTEWINTYIEMARAAKINKFSTRKMPKINVIIDPNKPGTLGYYMPADNSITINLMMVAVDGNWFSAKELYNVFLNQEDVASIPARLKNNKIYNVYVAYGFPCSTAPHEIEHYRRWTAHEGAHDSISGDLFPNDNKYRTFDQASNAVYEAVLQQGFLEAFIQKLRKRRDEIEKLIATDESVKIEVAKPELPRR
jgi:hypothetical protein